MRHFPIFMDLRNQHIALIGGGQVAMAKLRLLMKTEAKITVYAPKIHATIEEWLVAGRIHWRADAPSAADYQKARQVYIALDDETEIARYLGAARLAGALVNVVDDLENSDFITPALVDRDPVTIAIGTEGAAPVLARQIKAHLEEYLPADLGHYVGFGAQLRNRVADRSSEWRRAFWQWFYKGENAAAWRLNPVSFAADVDRKIDHEFERKGVVIFVGAGPGDPDLLTMRARRALDDADVVIYDRLVDPRILELARREANLIDVGKTPYQPTRTQVEINELIIKHAQQGANIVRLKSGDPVIYGRLDEEIDALADHDIAYEVVPGISTANAAAAALGTSLTRRGRNSSLRYITGHDAQGFADYQWRELAADGQALAIYMGRRAVKFFSGRLLMHGANPKTPVVAIANVSRLNEARVETTLDGLANALTTLEEGAPVIILYGIAHVRAQCKVELRELESIAL